jgi:hypothetical protein
MLDSLPSRSLEKLIMCSSGHATTVTNSHASIDSWSRLRSTSRKNVGVTTYGLSGVRRIQSSASACAGSCGIAFSAKNASSFSSTRHPLPIGTSTPSVTGCMHDTPPAWLV